MRVVIFNYSQSDIFIFIVLACNLHFPVKLIKMSLKIDIERADLQGGKVAEQKSSSWV